MHRAEVKLNTLSDADGAGAKDKNLLAAACLLHLIFTSVYRVIVRCGCRKLSRAGINHLVGGSDAVLVAHVMDLPLRVAGQIRDHVVRELHPLCLF